MPPKKSPIPPSHIETRSRNKLVHPGVPDKAAKRRTSADVQQEREAKAQAKAAQEKTKRHNINRAAEFEHADMNNEDVADATPRPAFTPKSRPLPRNHRKSILAPVAEDSDVEASDPAGIEPFEPCWSEGLASKEGSDSESDPPPLAKKLKTQPTGKATADPVRAKPAGKQRKAVSPPKSSDDEAMPASDEEPPQPKPKKAKVLVRDQINEVTRNIEQSKIQKTKY